MSSVEPVGGDSEAPATVVPTLEGSSPRTKAGTLAPIGRQSEPGQPEMMVDPEAQPKASVKIRSRTTKVEPEAQASPGQAAEPDSDATQAVAATVDANRAAANASDAEEKVHVQSTKKKSKKRKKSK
eukprot:GFYU01046896.1.p1 GENE.GFYU01046896.1~~GFYU01046896.1.p1  ORF type:complete len:127 (-),score=18.84 GFYU01046896.1:2-382(-)